MSFKDTFTKDGGLEMWILYFLGEEIVSLGWTWNDLEEVCNIGYIYIIYIYIIYYIYIILYIIYIYNMYIPIYPINISGTWEYFSSVENCEEFGNPDELLADSQGIPGGAYTPEPSRLVAMWRKFMCFLKISGWYGTPELHPKSRIPDLSHKCGLRVPGRLRFEHVV